MNFYDGEGYEEQAPAPQEEDLELAELQKQIMSKTFTAADYDDFSEEESSPESLDKAADDSIPSQFKSWAEENGFEVSEEEIAQMDSAEKVKERVKQLYAAEFLSNHDPLLAEAIKAGVPLQEHMNYVSQVNDFLNQPAENIAFEEVKQLVYDSLVKTGEVEAREGGQLTAAESKLIQEELTKRWSRLNEQGKARLAEGAKQRIKQEYDGYIAQYKQNAEKNAEREMQQYRQRMVKEVESTLKEYAKVKEYPVGGMKVNHDDFLKFAKEQLMPTEKGDAPFWEDIKKGDIRELLLYKYLHKQGALKNVTKQAEKAIKERLSITPLTGRR